MIEPKKILLLGDSNFCGEWFDPSINGITSYNCYWGKHTEILDDYNVHPKINYQVSHPGLQHYLEQKGHMVLNGSFGGASNFASLKVIFENFFLGKTTWNLYFTHPDVIIICLTEPLRELYRFLPDLPDDKGFFSKHLKPVIENSKTPEQLDSFLLKVFLDALQDIYDILKIPIILVEGWGRTNNLIRHYTFCYHLEEKWIEGITKLKHPIITTWATYEAVVAHFGKSLNVGRRDRILKNYERFHDRLQKKMIFPDGGHPSYEEHEKLSKKLLPIINKVPKYTLPKIDYKEYKKVFRPIF